MMQTKYSFLIIPILLLLNLSFSFGQRTTGISNSWYVWLDKEANWQTDSLYLPRTLNLKTLPENEPTGGWENLYAQKGKTCTLPASFEELMGNGDPTWRYHGVGWFVKEFEVPADWSQKTIQLNIEKARLRIEIYVNESLAGYDIVAETPYSTDISRYVKPGQKNRIAIRITNPGGQRGWNDAPATNWASKYKLIPGHDFGGLGNVSITVTNPCFIDDVFVKNLLPALGRNIEVQAAIKNNDSVDKQIEVSVEIVSYPAGKAIFSKTWEEKALKGRTTVFSQKLTVPDAKLWDTENPNLYYCKVSISGNGVSDTLQARFGFRTFEAKANEKGEQNYYLNGKRIRIRSAIDWGYYWQTGFYATDEMARKSVENAKAIGHNCISFHRRIGEPLVMKYADEMGLLIYEEPGGMQGVDELATPSWIMNTPQEKSYYVAFTAPEKFSRMVKRDRNHPSVVIWGIVNEQCTYDYTHKKIFDEAWKLDNSRMLVNQSGGHFGDASGYIPHMRPYEHNPRLNYIDDHTVDSKSRFQETDLFAHNSKNDSSIIYWGEVRCYCGPDNYYLLANPENKQGYDYKSWEVLGAKTEAYFKQNDFSKHPSIKTPADLSVQAGRGLMYIDGRLSQAILANNTNDGYAINGWSGGDQSLGDDFMAWYSAICDEGRNLKGPATDYNYWIRELQLVARRVNGKYFKPGDTVRFDIGLINENKLLPGSYELKIEVFDGKNEPTGLAIEKTVEVLGGDTYAQTFIPDYSVPIQKNWSAGYITLKCALFKKGKQIADGSEQVLLQNRSSYQPALKDRDIAVINWDSAANALKEAGAIPISYSVNEKADLTLAGNATNKETFLSILKQVTGGSTFVVRFDSAWAQLFFDQKILKEKVTSWGGLQKAFWNGNGWGYVDLLNRPIAVPSGYTIGTNSWEANSDPVGFEPFVSNFPQKSYGAFFFRPENLLTLMGEISYGKGKIILAPSYPVDDNNAFNDMLFFNHLISK
jgi:beta-galactosidase